MATGLQTCTACGTGGKLQMAGVTLVQELASDLQCPICLELFQQPVILPCSHVLCRTPCASNLLDFDFIRCPVCRDDSYISGGLDSLARVFVLDNIIEKVREQRHELRVKHGGLHTTGPQRPLQWAAGDSRTCGELTATGPQRPLQWAAGDSRTCGELTASGPQRPLQWAAGDSRTCGERTATGPQHLDRWESFEKRSASGSISASPAPPFAASVFSGTAYALEKWLTPTTESCLPIPVLSQDSGLQREGIQGDNTAQTIGFEPVLSPSYGDILFSGSSSYAHLFCGPASQRHKFSRSSSQGNLICSFSSQQDVLSSQTSDISHLFCGAMETPSRSDPVPLSANAANLSQCDRDALQERLSDTVHMVTANQAELLRGVALQEYLQECAIAGQVQPSVLDSGRQTVRKPGDLTLGHNWQVTMSGEEKPLEKEEGPLGCNRESDAGLTQSGPVCCQQLPSTDNAGLRAPGTPTIDVTRCARGEDTVTLFLAPPSDPCDVVDTYELRYCTEEERKMGIEQTVEFSTGQGSKMCPSAGPQVMVLPHLRHGATYYFCITARNGAGASACSDVVQCVTLGSRHSVVPFPTITESKCQTYSSSIRVFTPSPEDVAPEQQISHWLLYRPRGQHLWRAVALHGSREHQVFGLAPDTDHQVVVMACNLRGECQLSPLLVLRTNT